MAATTLASLSASMTLGFQINAQKALTGFQNIPFTNAVTNAKSIASTTLFNAAGGGNAVHVAIHQLANSANVTMNLTCCADPFGTNFAFAAVKAISFELISVAQNSSVGTNCTSVLVGGGSANQALAGTGGLFGDTSDKVRVTNGGHFQWASGAAAGVAVAAGSTQSLYVENQDAGNTTYLRVVVIGNT